MMIATLPMFPLELVAFPGEELALHIFEQRYKQLIEDCEDEKITFGIPAYINKRLQYGTEMEVLKVVKKYPSGASDVICKGIRVFRLVDFYSKLNDKLYAGGTVQFVNAVQDGTMPLKEKFVQLLSAFYDELDIQTPEVNLETITTYTLSHKMGLTIEQEYGLLQLASEKKRYEFLIQHLTSIVTTLRSVNRAKEIIKLNGHFKNFDPLDFEEY